MNTFAVTVEKTKKRTHIKTMFTFLQVNGQELKGLMLQLEPAE